MKGECSDCGKSFESHAQTYIVENRRICRFCWVEHKRQTTTEKRDDAA